MSDKSIQIKNIYYMLSYAFCALQQNQYEKVGAEEFEHIHDLFAAILSKGISSQLKQGLYKEYMEKQENLPVLRGKLEIQETVYNRMQKKQMVFCQYDELSEDNLYNQILKTTCLLLLKQPTVSKEKKEKLKRVLLFFKDIKELDAKKIKWEQLRYWKNNQNYCMLLNLCHLVLDGMLLTTEQGSYKLTSFLDEKKMSHLYEKFILEYYRYHYPLLHPKASQISWNVDDGSTEFLPVMQTDITLKQKDKILIIDAKYYAHIMQHYYDTNKIHSNHLYQIYTYVKNMDKKHLGNVSGMLLYAKTDEQIVPDHDFWMEGNKISVKTLDLNVPFEKIKEQLNGIAEEEFGKIF